MTSANRATYDEIKTDALSVYYTFCLDRGHLLGRPHEQLIESVDYNFENVYQLPVDRLMFQVVLLVLCAGMHPAIESRMRDSIKGIVQSNDLGLLLSNAAPEESTSFMRDVRALGLS